MENLYIAATRTSPEIRFDCEKHLLEIKGESFPEDTAEFYTPVLSWVEDYLNFIEEQKAVVNMELIYFNSSTSKIFMDLLDLLDEAAKNGKHISLNWIYDYENENAFLAGGEFQEDIESLEFNLIQKDPQE